MAANANKPGAAQMAAASELGDAGQIMVNASQACDDCEFFPWYKMHHL